MGKLWECVVIQTYLNFYYRVDAGAQLTILVDAACRARITDFGFGMVTLARRSRKSPYDLHYLARWISPEAHEGVFTKALDIFSFAMLMVEVRGG